MRVLDREPAKHDPTFNGPLKNRGCTDVICCIFFMVFIGGYLVVGVLAWLYGDPRQVIYPRNSTGVFCGIGPNEGKPYVFYFDILKCATGTNIMAAALNGLQCPTTQVCVNTCPNSYWIVPLSGYFPNVNPRDVFSDKYCSPAIDLQTTKLTVDQILSKELCARFYIPSTPVFNRCIPKIADLPGIPSNFTLPGTVTANETASSIINATGDLFMGFNAKALGVKIFEDFAKSWYWIVILLFLLLLRFVAGVMVWVLIVGVIGVIGYGIWHCYWEYSNYKANNASISAIGFTSDISVLLRVQETWLAFLIILAVLEVVLLLSLIFLRKRILIAIALIKEASKLVSVCIWHCYWEYSNYKANNASISAIGFTSDVSVLLRVQETWLAFLIILAVLEVVLLLSLIFLRKRIFIAIALIKEASKLVSSFNASSSPCESARCMFLKYNEEGLFQQNLFNLQIYNVLGFLWCMNFVLALGQCTMAGAFASYYWAFNKPGDLPYFPVASSFLRTLRYHVGSLAFGSLILTIVQFIRIILEYLDHKFKAAQNPCTRFIMCCLKCCFWCLEKFIKFLNRNAYIMIAVYGKNFCTSAKNAFCLLMRNIVRVVVLDKVTDLLLLFGKLMVVGGVGVLAFFFFSGRIEMPGETFSASSLNYYWVPIITVVVGSYMIAKGFFSVYSMCVDTLFLCFLEDLERNDGSPEKPYYMPKSLMKILSKKNKQPKQNKK
ncbi:UNVERIFIED_CONTAM: hypothetical protein FKN15_049133 [Acipenser sinensis]